MEEGHQETLHTEWAESVIAWAQSSPGLWMRKVNVCSNKQPECKETGDGAGIAGLLDGCVHPDQNRPVTSQTKDVRLGTLLWESVLPELRVRKLFVCLIFVYSLLKS